MVYMVPERKIGRATAVNDESIGYLGVEEKAEMLYKTLLHIEERMVARARRRRVVQSHSDVSSTQPMCTRT